MTEHEQEMAAMRQELATAKQLVQSMKNAYAQSVKSEHMSGGAGEESAVRALLGSYASQPKLRVKGPAKFTGAVNPNDRRSVADQLEDWLLAMNRYDKYVSRESAQSDSEKVEHLVDFLDGEAGAAAHRAIESNPDALWCDIADALRKHFCVATSGQALLNRLKETKQLKGETMASFHSRFQHALDAMVRAKIGDMLTCSDIFMSNMNGGIRDWVQKARALMATDGIDGFKSTQPSDAVRWLSDLAERGEKFVTTAQPSLSVAAVQEDHQEDSNRAARWTSMAKRAARDLGLSVALVTRRFEARQCAKCGVEGHGYVKCKAKSSNDVAPKLNAAAVVDKAPTQSVDPKGQAQ